MSGGGGGGGASVPTLQSADDAVQLIVYCGDDQQGVAQVLNPALIKLCKSRKGRGGELLALSAQNGSDPLQFIDPAKHSLGYLYFL